MLYQRYTTSTSSMVPMTQKKVKPSPSPATKMRQGGVKMIKNRNWQLIKIRQRDFLCTLHMGGGYTGGEANHSRGGSLT
jgi:hypothetical protein